MSILLDPSGKVTLQLPDSLLGKKICMATKMLQISDPGEAVAGQLSETCIPLVFVRDGNYIELSQLTSQVEENPGAAVVRRFKAVPGPSGCVRLDLTNLFLTEYRGLGTFPVGAYNSNNGSVMRNHNPVAGECRVESVFNEGDLCGAVCNMRYTMDAYLYGVMKVQGEFFLNCRVAKFLFIPKDNDTVRIEKDERFGAKSIKLQSKALPDREIVTREYLLHRDLSHDIVFHMDTLMPPAWKEGVRRAVMQWNRGFEQCGLGSPLKVRDMSCSDSMLTDSFIYVPSGMDRYECTLLYDPLDALIYNSSIVLHSNYIDRLCKEYVVQTATADPRTRTCGNLPEEVVSEVVMAAVMPAIGKSLGFTENSAASFHGSAHDLTDTAYTSVYGISNSAMEAPVFNYLASEQDYRRAVPLYQDRLSPYDLMCISLLYSGTMHTECDIPYSTAKDSEGRYIPWSVRGDLSSEPIKALELAGLRQRELAESLEEWFEDDRERERIAAEARGFYARLIVRLTDYLTEEWDRGPGHTEVVECVLRQLRDLDWMKDDQAQTMYRTNIFRQMCQRCGKAETLGIIYDRLNGDEELWEDMLLTELEGRSLSDAGALAVIRKMQKRSSSPFIRKRIEKIL